MPGALTGPDFIGVGPEKTGTSWIDRQLRAHPDVKLPPVKELRYFWEKSQYPGETFLQRLAFKESWHRMQYREYGINCLKRLIRHPVQSLFKGRERLIWDYRYLMLPHDDQWYLTALDRKDKRLSGEISPQYFFRPENEIQAIHELLPACKVIISLRKPIDWIWSFAKMNTRSGFLQSEFGSLDNYIDTKMKKFSFSKSLGYWQQYFPADQLLVLFYDQLKEDPWGYYQKICTFLGLEPEEARRAIVGNKVNVGSKESLPEEYIEKIRTGWREDIKALSAMVPGVPSSWLE
jgi:hypothetical protein